MKTCVSDMHVRGEDDVTCLHLVAKYKPKKVKASSSPNSVSSVVLLNAHGFAAVCLIFWCSLLQFFVQ